MGILRPFLLCVVVALAFTFGHSLFSATAPGATGAMVAFSVAELVQDLGVPTLALLAVALLAGLAQTGPVAVGAGVRFLLGRERPTTLRAAHRGLAAMARAMVSAGLVFGLLAAAAAFFLLQGRAAAVSSGDPQQAGRLIQFCLAMPLAALGIGRLCLGGAADAAAVRAGETGRRAFRSADDLLLLLYLLPPVLVLAVVAMPAPMPS